MSDIILYWSTGEPILVEAPTYIASPDDLYRFAYPSMVMDTANPAFLGGGAGAQSGGNVWGNVVWRALGRNTVVCVLQVAIL